MDHLQLDNGYMRVDGSKGHRGVIKPRAVPLNPELARDLSLPFLIGKIACHKTLAIGDFTDAGLRDSHAIAVARRVKYKLDPTLERGVNGYGVGIVEVQLNDGRTLRHETEYPLGHPNNALSWDELALKFRQCAAASALPVAASVVDEVVDLVANLESLPDASVINETLFNGMQTA